MSSVQGGGVECMWNGDNKTVRKINEGELGEGGRGNSRDDGVAPKVVMNYRKKERAVCKTSAPAQSVATMKVCIAFIIYSFGFNGISGWLRLASTLR